MVIDDNIKNEVIRFYTLAIVGEFIVWLRNGLKEEKQSILDRIVRLMDGTIQNIIIKNNK